MEEDNDTVERDAMLLAQVVVIVIYSDGPDVHATFLTQRFNESPVDEGDVGVMEDDDDDDDELPSVR